MHVKILHTILTVEFLSYIWWTNSNVYPSSSFLFWCTQSGPLASMVIRIVLLWDLLMNSWCDKERTTKEKPQKYNFVLNFEWTDFDPTPRSLDHYFQRLLWRQRSPIQSRLILKVSFLEAWIAFLCIKRHQLVWQSH